MFDFLSFLSNGASAVVETVASAAGNAIIAGLAVIGEFSIWLASKFLWAAAHLLNLSIELSISSSTYEGLGALEIGWTLCRDFANLFFVFVLLYIAIATILQLSGYGAKQLLVKVLIIALLVNFSLVITNVVIDASNIFAMEFYGLINAIPGVNNPNIGISGIIAGSVGIQSVFDLNGVQDWGGLSTGEQTLQSVIIGSLFGTAFILLLAFVFAATAFMMMLRMVTLIFLMILSPLAFLAMILPKTGQYASMWWNKLFKEAFFAPVILFLLYVVMRIMVSGQVSNVIFMGTGADPTASFTEAFTSDNLQSLGIILNYIVMMGLTVGALFASKHLGAAGSGATMALGAKTVKGVRSYAGDVGKRTIARTVARPLAESEGVQKIAARIPLGRDVMRGVEAGAKWGGLDKLEEKKASSAGSFMAKLPADQKAKYIKNLDVRTQRSIVEKMKPEERAEMMKSAPELSPILSKFASVTKKASESETAKKIVAVPLVGGATVAGLKKVSASAEERSKDETIYGRMMAKLSPKEKFATEKAGKEFKRKKTVEEITDPTKSMSGPDQSKFATSIQSIRPKDMREALEEGGEKAKQFFGRLAKLNEGGTIKDLNYIVRELGNPQLAAQIKSNPAAKSMLEAYGVIVPEDGDKKTKSKKDKKDGDSKKEPLIKVAGKYENLDKYKS